MSYTLLMQLVAPMQSWGVQSNFTHRDTGLEPSKSGVIGLICAALGRDRAEDISDLAKLKMGVRVDREGLLKVDYHTANNVMMASGKPFIGLKPTELSNRFYLSDAGFLVGLEGNNCTLLEHIQHHLQHPVWMVFLGRKAFVPSKPIWLADGLRALPVRAALETYPRILPDVRSDDYRVRLAIEDPEGESVRPDQPVCYKKGARQFTTRRVATMFCDLPSTPHSSTANPEM